MLGDNIKSFSAKDLCSKSCMQIKMYTEHPELRPQPNINTDNGVSFQHTIALKTDNVIGEEMRGSYFDGNIWINFSNDIVCDNKIIEVKSINRKVEDWYFKSSIFQCAVYKSLLLKSNKKLVTSTFYVQMGNPLVETTVNSDIDYYLQFGDELYLIDVNNPDKIVEFIVEKANASTNWDLARSFDMRFKHREYDELKDYFVFKKI